MTNRKQDQDSETASPADSDERADSGPEVVPQSRPDRRAFLRQLSGDAVVTAGRLAGFSSVLRRSAVAAGQAATRDLQAQPGEEMPTGPTPGPTDPAVIDPPPEPPTLSGPAPGPRPIPALTPAQHDLLVNGSTAALGVNDPAGAPHLTSSIYHWDGSTIRLPARLFTARAEHVDRDPQVSLLIEDEASDGWVALTGIASVVYGEQVEGEMMLILAKYLATDAAVHRWEEMRSSGDQVVIQVRPTRFVWRPPSGSPTPAT